MRTFVLSLSEARSHSRHPRLACLCSLLRIFVIVSEAHTLMRSFFSRCVPSQILLVLKDSLFTYEFWGKLKIWNHLRGRVGESETGEAERRKVSRGGAISGVVRAPLISSSVFLHTHTHTTLGFMSCKAPHWRTPRKGIEGERGWGKKRGRV